MIASRRQNGLTSFTLLASVYTTEAQDWVKDVACQARQVWPGSILILEQNQRSLKVFIDFNTSP